MIIPFNNDSNYHRLGRDIDIIHEMCIKYHCTLFKMANIFIQYGFCSLYYDENIIQQLTTTNNTKE